MPPDFPFHDMDCSNYCGPTCLLMALESRGVPLTGLTQSGLMEEVDDNSAIPLDAFASSPEAMLEIVNLKLASATAPQVHYEMFPAGLDAETANGTPVKTVTACLNEIRECLKNADPANPDAPVFVLSRGGDHWILVFHLDDLGTPQKSNDEYYVRSPDGGGSCNANTPAVIHDTGAAGDGDCTKCRDKGEDTVESHKSIKEYLSVNERTSPPGFKGHRILLVPRRIVVQAHAMVAAPAMQQAAQYVGQDQQLPRDEMPADGCQVQEEQEEEEEEDGPVPRPVSEEEAETIVQERLVSYVRHFPKHGKLLEHAVARDAVRVHYLPDPTMDYYLVPIFAGNNKAPHFLAKVSVADGGIRSMSSIRADVPGKVRWLFEVPSDQKTFGDGWVSDKKLVWQHSAQTHSPFRPLLAVRKGEARGFYDLFSDTVYEKLTPANVRRKTLPDCDCNQPPPDTGQHAR